jgi:hypothetical protein
MKNTENNKQLLRPSVTYRRQQLQNILLVYSLVNNAIIRTMQNVLRVKTDILGGKSIGHSKQKKLYTYMCPILNGFRNTAISVCSTCSLDLAPNIVLPSGM